MASDRITNNRLAFPGRKAPPERSSYRLNVLRSIEEALTKARLDAHELEAPVLGYFLDMAVAELKSCEAVEEDSAYTDAKNRLNTLLRSVS